MTEDAATADAGPGADAADQVTLLYGQCAAGLVRMAMLMLGDQGAAEDVVQEAFLGLYRRWDALHDPGLALAYARASVLNGCRQVLRGRMKKLPAADLLPPDAVSAEASALLAEEHREVIAALRLLPARQREAVVLRVCLGLPEAEVAEAMNISRGTVKSASHRGLAALARILKEAAS